MAGELVDLKIRQRMARKGEDYVSAYRAVMRSSMRSAGPTGGTAAQGETIATAR